MTDEELRSEMVGESHATGKPVVRPETADEQRVRTCREAIKVLADNGFFTIKSTTRVHLELSHGGRTYKAVGDTEAGAYKELLKVFASTRPRNGMQDEDD